MNLFLRMVGNFLLFLFIAVVMIDPTNTLFHAKELTFALLMFFSVVRFKPDLSYIPHILIIAAALLLGYLSAEMQGNAMDNEMLAGTFKNIAPLALLPYIRNYDFVRRSLFPTLLTTTLLLVLFGFTLQSPVYEKAIFYFVKAHDNFIMMTHRHILGFTFFGMYYKTLICMAFSAFLLYYRMLHGIGHRWLNILLALIVTSAFLVSGTRASMLLPFSLLGIAIVNTVSQGRRAKYFVYPLLGLIGFAFLFLIFLLVTEQGEASNAIKFGHLPSYWQLFNDHPEYLFIGQGPATSFYTEGFHEMTLQTEWTYLELLRNYGLLSLPILGVFAYPLVRLFRHRSDPFTQGVFFTYVVYLLIAGTNPLLLSSTGMLMILSAYSYCEQVDARLGSPTEPTVLEACPADRAFSSPHDGEVSTAGAGN